MDGDHQLMDNDNDNDNDNDSSKWGGMEGFISVRYILRLTRGIDIYVMWRYGICVKYC